MAESKRARTDAPSRLRIYELLEQHAKMYDYTMPAHISMFTDMLVWFLDRPLFTKLAALGYGNGCFELDEAYEVASVTDLESIMDDTDFMPNGSERSYELQESALKILQHFPFEYRELFDEANETCYRALSETFRAEYASLRIRTIEEAAKERADCAPLLALLPGELKPLRASPILLDASTDSMREFAMLIVTRMKTSGALARLESAVDLALPERKVVIDGELETTKLYWRIREARRALARLLGNDPVIREYGDDS